MDVSLARLLLIGQREAVINFEPAFAKASTNPVKNKSVRSIYPAAVSHAESKAIEFSNSKLVTLFAVIISKLSFSIVSIEGRFMSPA